ncbi:MAG: GNAT family N-acetyltransferase [Chloroflexi bacterium]|nr:GNAT family N-acetyltransferase [Chloroflexota bacterium]MDA1001768.1 GNAT family N-acetyltransferase [Chloroflexota bacterium]
MATLRPARADDFQLLYEINREALQGFVTATWGAWDEAFQQRWCRDHFLPGRAQAILSDDGAVVGYFDAERQPSCWFLHNIVLAPAWHRHGIGASLIRDLLARASEEGVPVELRVLRVNPARGLYERLGFEVTGQTGTHDLMRWVPLAA